jgi:DNA-directed RNA polymerase specialized sigma subunit
VTNNTDKYKADIDSQIIYASRKYGGNLPSSVAKAHATMLANEAMKSYSPSKGNVKTYLSKRLQKLSRIAYKASTPLNIPESRLMNRAKIQDYVDEYKDTFGRVPTHQEIVKNVGIKSVDAKNFMAESAPIAHESAFDNIHGASIEHVSGANIIRSLPEDIRSIGHDVYVNNLGESDILKKHKIGRTTFFSKKKKIDSFIKDHSGLANIQYN